MSCLQSRAHGVIIWSAAGSESPAPMTLPAAAHMVSFLGWLYSLLLVLLCRCPTFLDLQHPLFSDVTWALSLQLHAAAFPGLSVGILIPLQTGEMAQTGKGLLYKCEDLSSEPQNTSNSERANTSISSALLQ